MGQGNEGKETSEEIKEVVIFIAAIIIILYLGFCNLLTY